MHIERAPSPQAHTAHREHPLQHRKDAGWPGLLDAMKDVAQQHGPETTLSQAGTTNEGERIRIENRKRERERKREQGQ